MMLGCGRIGFDPTTALGHDEDADGVPDSDDVCPHIAGSQADSDGDGVGDDCDPNPTVARDTIAMFATMQPGDQPLTAESFSAAVFEQREDALALIPTGSQHVLAQLSMPLVVGDVRVAVGFDIIERIEPSAQHQFAVGIGATLPFYYVELNELPPDGFAQITLWDGRDYLQADARTLATVVHPGPVVLQTTQRVGTGVRLDVGWPGESYVAEVMDAVYQGSQDMLININDLHVEIRWLIVITSS